jgi:O-antigen ligase
MAPNGTDAQPAPLKAAGALLAAFLFVLPFSSTLALRNSLLGLGAACLLYAAATGRAARPRLPPWRVLAPMLAYGAWSAASVAWSVNPAYSLSELRPGLLYPLVAFLAFFAATPDARAIDRWAQSLSAGLAALGLAAVAQVAMTGWWDPERWHGDTGFYATHVVLALPLLAWAFVRAGPGRRGLRAGLAATTALTLVVTAWNDNRIAWIALAAMTVLALAISRDLLRGHRSRGALAFAAAALAVFAALFAWSLQQRTERLEGTPYAAEAQIQHDPRPALWDYAARRHGEAPWAGFGYGRGILDLQFRMGVTPGVDNPKHTHAHNTALNVLLQGGLVGLAIFAWMVFAIAREMAAGLAAGEPRRFAAMLGIVLLAGFAIRNTTDDFLVRHSAMLAFALAGAVLGALRPTSASTPG